MFAAFFLLVALTASPALGEISTERVSKYLQVSPSSRQVVGDRPAFCDPQTPAIRCIGGMICLDGAWPIGAEVSRGGQPTCRKASSVWPHQSRLAPQANHNLAPVGRGAFVKPAKRDISALPSKERRRGNASICGNLLDGLALLVAHVADERGELSWDGRLVNGVGFAGHASLSRNADAEDDPSPLQLPRGVESHRTRALCKLRDVTAAIYGDNRAKTNQLQVAVMRSIASDKTKYLRGLVAQDKTKVDRLVSGCVHCCLLMFDAHASILQLIGNNASGILQNNGNIFSGQNSPELASSDSPLPSTEAWELVKLIPPPLPPTDPDEDCAASLGLTRLVPHFSPPVFEGFSACQPLNPISRCPTR